MAEGESQYHRGKSYRKEHCPHWIKTLLVALEGFSEHAHANAEDKSTDGDVDIEYPAPGQILGDQTSNGRPRANPESHHHSIQTECAPALARREDARNHRGIDGKDERSPYSLQETGDDQ